MALLNGRYVDDSEIDPVKHKFIGMFREPFSKIGAKLAGYVACSCGHTLQTYEEVFAHWQMGHFDIPQYVNLEGE